MTIWSPYDKAKVYVKRSVLLCYLSCQGLSLNDGKQDPHLRPFHTHSQNLLTPLTLHRRLNSVKFPVGMQTNTHLLKHTLVPPGPAQRCNLHPSWNIEQPEREGAARVTHHELPNSWRRSTLVLRHSLNIPGGNITLIEEQQTQESNLPFSDIFLFSDVQWSWAVWLPCSAYSVNKQKSFVFFTISCILLWPTCCLDSDVFKQIVTHFHSQTKL